MRFGVGAAGWCVIELPDFRVPLPGGCGATSRSGPERPNSISFRVAQFGQDLWTEAICY